MSILTNADFKTLFFTDKDKSLFYLSMQELSKKLGCFYISYIFEDINNNIRVGFGSNPDWQTQYIKQNLMSDCHLFKCGIKKAKLLKKNFLIFHWETAFPKSSREKDIVLYRNEFGIGSNGISFFTLKNGRMESFALAPENNNSRFVKYVSQNIDLVRGQLDVYRLSTINVLSRNKNEGEVNDKN